MQILENYFWQTGICFSAEKSDLSDLYVWWWKKRSFKYTVFNLLWLSKCFFFQLILKTHTFNYVKNLDVVRKEARKKSVAKQAAAANVPKLKLLSSAPVSLMLLFILPKQFT